MDENCLLNAFRGSVAGTLHTYMDGVHKMHLPPRQEQQPTTSTAAEELPQTQPPSQETVTLLADAYKRQQQMQREQHEKRIKEKTQAVANARLQSVHQPRQQSHTRAQRR